MHLDGWQWALAALAAFLVGLSKTGIAGIGIFAVAIFASVFPPLLSTGIVLPILISADIVAVGAYRRHAVHSHLVRLFPWAAVGIVLGYFAMEHISGEQVARLIGAVLMVMVVLHIWRTRSAQAKTRPTPNPPTSTPQPPTQIASSVQTPSTEIEVVPHSLWFAAIMGLTAGFTTMLANAAGPIMIMYLLAMRLPKMEFFGTSAWYFLVLNLFKVPFSHQLGLISLSSLQVDLWLAPFAVMGALFGRALIPYINQKLFENLALACTLLAGLRLLLG